jgi:hypothetical protein
MSASSSPSAARSVFGNNDGQRTSRSNVEVQPSLGGPQSSYGLASAK